MAGNQFSSQTMACFIPVPSTQFGVGETMQVNVMLIGVILKRRSQIQHLKSRTHSEFLKP